MSCGRLADLREKHKVPTIKHGARHSFASYWLAMHGDIDQLCRFLGHDDPQTTFALREGGDQAGGGKVLGYYAEGGSEGRCVSRGGVKKKKKKNPLGNFHKLFLHCLFVAR